MDEVWPDGSRPEANRWDCSACANAPRCWTVKSTSSAARAEARPSGCAFRSIGRPKVKRNNGAVRAVLSTLQAHATCMEKARILVVEDESLIAEDIQERLKSSGYEVPAVAHSGEEALRASAETRPDLVLMDIRLKGGMDGVETARLLRERHNLPVIYLTGDAEDTTLFRSKATEPVGYTV